MFSSSNDHRSAHRNRHRTRSGTCGLVHKPSFDSTFQLSLRKVRETRPIYAGCAALRMFLPRFLGSPIANPAPWPDGLSETQDCNDSTDSARTDWQLLVMFCVSNCPSDPAPMRRSAARTACCSIMIDSIREEPSEVSGRLAGEAKNLNLNLNSAT